MNFSSAAASVFGWGVSFQIMVISCFSF